MLIRRAQSSDAEAIASIFNHEVEEGLSNYESRRHSPLEREEWLERLEKSEYPVMVAEENERVLGFAALTPFHPLSGYRFTVTGSIYVDSSTRRAGVGKSLATELLKEARIRRYHSILAGVNSENVACLALLKTFGFEPVGHFREIGWKNGKWRDDICLQLLLD